MIRLLVALTWLVAVGSGEAHSPHDNVEALAVSEDPQGQSVILAIVSKNQLLRSVDGGVAWTEVVRGLEGAEIFTDVATSRGADSTPIALLATDGNGVFRSADLGRSWTRSSAGLVDPRIARVRLAPDVVESGIVYALTRAGTLYRSRDAGMSWSRVPLDIGPVSALAFRSATSAHGLLVGTTNGRLAAVDPAGDVVRVLHDAAGVGIIRDIAVVPRPSGPELILLGTQRGGILRSADGGASFTPAAGVAGTTDVTAFGQFATDGHGPMLLALGWNEAVFRSRDGGAHWQLSSTGLTTDPQATVPEHFSPQFMAIAVMQGTDRGRVLLIGGFDGFFRSEDDGQTWTEYQTKLPDIIDSMHVSPPVADDFCLAIATYGAGVWRKCDSEPDWEVANRGLRELRISSVAYSTRFADDGVLMAVGPYGICVTERGRPGWRDVDLNFGRFDRIARRVMGALRNRAGLPPSVTTDLLAHRGPPFLSKLAIPYDYADTHAIYATSRSDGVLRIDVDSGAAEVLRARGSDTQDLLLSPDFEHDGTMFAAARDDGVWKSTDRGRTWQDVNTGLQFLDDWHADRTDPVRSQAIEISPTYEIKLAMSPGFPADATMFAGTSRGLYRSRNGGASWESQTEGLGPAPAFVAALAVSSDFPHDRVVMVSIAGRGLFRSVDGGDSFRPTSPDDDFIDDFRIRNIAFSPRHRIDGKIFVASERHLLESDDRGATWRVLPTPLRLEGRRGVIRFEGQWQELVDPAFTGTFAWLSSSAGSRVRVPFHGTGIRVYGKAAAEAQLAATVDREPVPIASLVGPTGPSDAPWLELGGLDCASHVFELALIGVSGGQAAHAGGLLLDAIDVTGHTCDYTR